MKLTKKHFDLFKSECLKWIDGFELNNWEIYFSWQEKEEFRATTKSKLSGYVATIFLSRDWEFQEALEGTNLENEIKKSAKHEIIHLLLARLSTNGAVRFISLDDCQESEEELVRKLEKIIK